MIMSDDEIDSWRFGLFIFCLIFLTGDNTNLYAFELHGLFLEEINLIILLLQLHLSPEILWKQTEKCY